MRDEDFFKSVRGAGYAWERTAGSHHIFYRREDRDRGPLVAPIHNHEIKPEIAAALLKIAWMSAVEYTEYSRRLLFRPSTPSPSERTTLAIPATEEKTKKKKAKGHSNKTKKATSASHSLSQRFSTKKERPSTVDDAGDKRAAELFAARVREEAARRDARLDGLRALGRSLLISAPERLACGDYKRVAAEIVQLFREALNPLRQDGDGGASGSTIDVEEPSGKAACENIVALLPRVSNDCLGVSPSTNSFTSLTGTSPSSLAGIHEPAVGDAGGDRASTTPSNIQPLFGPGISHQEGVAENEDGTCEREAPAAVTEQGSLPLDLDLCCLAVVAWLEEATARVEETRTQLKSIAQDCAARVREYKNSPVAVAEAEHFSFCAQLASRLKSCADKFNLIDLSVLLRVLQRIEQHFWRNGETVRDLRRYAVRRVSDLHYRSGRDRRVVIFGALQKCIASHPATPHFRMTFTENIDEHESTARRASACHMGHKSSASKWDKLRGQVIDELARKVTNLIMRFCDTVLQHACDLRCASATRATLVHIDALPRSGGSPSPFPTARRAVFLPNGMEFWTSRSRASTASSESSSDSGTDFEFDPLRKATPAQESHAGEPELEQVFGELAPDLPELLTKIMFTREIENRTGDAFDWAKALRNFDRLFLDEDLFDCSDHKNASNAATKCHFLRLMRDCIAEATVVTQRHWYLEINRARHLYRYKIPPIEFERAAAAGACLAKSVAGILATPWRSPMSKPIVQLHGELSQKLLQDTFRSLLEQMTGPFMVKCMPLRHDSDFKTKGRHLPIVCNAVAAAYALALTTSRVRLIDEKGWHRFGDAVSRMTCNSSAVLDDIRKTILVPFVEHVTGKSFSQSFRYQQYCEKKIGKRVLLWLKLWGTTMARVISPDKGRDEHSTRTHCEIVAALLANVSETLGIRCELLHRRAARSFSSAVAASSCGPSCFPDLAPLSDLVAVCRHCPGQSISSADCGSSGSSSTTAVTEKPAGVPVHSRGEDAVAAGKNTTIGKQMRRTRKQQEQELKQLRSFSENTKFTSARTEAIDLVNTFAARWSLENCLAATPRSKQNNTGEHEEPDGSRLADLAPRELCQFLVELFELLAALDRLEDIFFAIRKNLRCTNDWKDFEKRCAAAAIRQKERQKDESNPSDDGGGW